MSTPSNSIDKILAECESWLDKHPGKTRQDFLESRQLTDRLRRALEAHFKDEEFLQRLSLPRPKCKEATATGNCGILNATTARLPSDSAPQPPQIDGFTIQKLLGRGGMGEVWEADQIAPVSRRVAIKIIRTDLPSTIPVDIYVDRFLRETDSLARMEHPNIARVLHAGQTNTGLPFMTMEFVEGIPITAYCDEKRLSIHERLKLFQTVCRAIHHAHQRRRIHRDIKPSNILVTEVDGGPAVRVIDFGIALVMDNYETTETSSVMQSYPAGTWSYMSPEQITQNSSIDIRSDVYSLGILLSELLVGPDNSSAAKDRPAPSQQLSDAIAVRTICENRSTRTQSLKRILKKELDFVVARACRLHPKDRYDSAASLERDIANFVDGNPTEAHPDTLLYRSSKTFARYRSAIATVSAVFLFLIAAVWWMQTQWRLSEKLRRDQAFSLAVANWSIGRPREAIRIIESQPSGSGNQIEWKLARERFQGTRWTRKFRHAITTADVSHDGSLAAVGLADGRVTLLDLQGLSGCNKATLSTTNVINPKKNCQVATVQFSPNGQQLLIAYLGIDAEACVQNISEQTRQQLAFPESLREQTPRLIMAEYLSETSIVGCYHLDGNRSCIVVWDLKTNTVVATEYTRTRVNSICALSHDALITGQQSIAGKPTNDLVVWQLNENTLVPRQHIRSAHRKTICSIQCNKERTGIVTTDANTSHTWRIKRGVQLKVLTRPVFEMDSQRRIAWHHQATFAHNNRTIAVSQDDGRIAIWDSGSMLRELIGHTSAVNETVFFQREDQKWLLSVGDDCLVKVWNMDIEDSTSLVLRTGKSGGGSFGTRAIILDSEHIATVTHSLLQFWHPKTGQQIGEIAFAQPVQAIAGDPRRIFVELISGEIWRVDFQNQLSPEKILPAQTYPVVPPGHRPGNERVKPLQTIAYHSASETLVTRSDKGGLQLRHVLNGKLQADQNRELTLDSPSNCTLCVAISADGTRVAAGSYNGFVYIKDLNASDSQAQALRQPGSEQIRSKTATNVPVTCVAFSPDKRWLAAGKINRKIDIWNLDDGKKTRLLKGHADWLTSLQFNENGTRILSGAHDGSARLWNFASGRELLCFDDFKTGKVTAVRFLPEDAGILIGGNDGTLRLHAATKSHTPVASDDRRPHSSTSEAKGRLSH